MRVAIRVDASARMGTGHLRRCMALVEALRDEGAQTLLVCRAHDSVSELAYDGGALTWLPAPEKKVPDLAPSPSPPHAAWAGVSWDQDAAQTVAALRDFAPEWVLVDHYAFDARWHQHVGQALACRLLVIDDTADRCIAADVLLDHNWDADHQRKYLGRLAREPVWLSGPRYALLAASYRHAPRYPFHATVRSIGIFMGGTDPGGTSALVLAACRDAGFEGPIEVVSTSVNPFLKALREACAASPGTTLTLDAPDLSAFFARHDLQIGAGGGASWERCCIGPPTIALALADNQSLVVSALDGLGAIRGASTPVGGPQPDARGLPALADVLPGLLSDPKARQAMSARAMSLVDGRGAQRVALYVLRETLRLRPAGMDDAVLLHSWRNHPTIRAVSGSADVIAYPEHVCWLQRVLQATDRWLFVAQVGNLAVGCIRFDQLQAGRVEVSLYLDPELSALGLGSRMLLAGERQMKLQLQATFVVEAAVVAGNIVSQHLFERCGYAGGPLQYRKRIAVNI